MYYSQKTYEIHAVPSYSHAIDKAERIVRVSTREIRLWNRKRDYYLN